MSNFATSADIDNVYGKVNVDRWADINNDANVTTIATRRSWALSIATEEIQSLLAGGKYDTSFSSVPKFIVFLTAMKAGILLYDSRSVLNAIDVEDRFTRYHKEFKRYVRKIKSGQMKLLHPTSGEELENQCPAYPSAVEPDDYPDYVAENNPCDCTGSSEDSFQL